MWWECDTSVSWDGKMVSHRAEESSCRSVYTAQLWSLPSCVTLQMSHSIQINIRTFNIMQLGSLFLQLPLQTLGFILQGGQGFILLQAFGCHLGINKRERVAGEEGGGGGSSVWWGWLHYQGCSSRLEAQCFFFFSTRIALFGSKQKSTACL